MRRGIASLVGLVAATIVLVSCGEDARRGTLPSPLVPLAPVADSPTSHRRGRAPRLLTSLR